MSRMMSRPRYREGVSLGTKFSEYAVIILIAVLLVAAGRYYFVVYRHSPGYVLGEYLGAIKKGDPEAQYALIDDDDKRLWYPTEDAYAKQAKQANGYTERIGSVAFSNEKIDPNKPNLAKVDATVSIRRAGEKIYESASDTYTDHYTLRKDKDGNWKVWLKESQMNMLQSAPTPAGQPL